MFYLFMNASVIAIAVSLPLLGSLKCFVFVLGAKKKKKDSLKNSSCQSWRIFSHHFRLRHVWKLSFGRLAKCVLWSHSSRIKWFFCPALGRAKKTDPDTKRSHPSKDRACLDYKIVGCKWPLHLPLLYLAISWSKKRMLTVDRLFTDDCWFCVIPLSV